VAAINRKDIREEAAARVKGFYPKRPGTTKWLEDNLTKRLEALDELTEELIVRETHRAIIDLYNR